jgi:retron-type reverse transcriptase
MKTYKNLYPLIYAFDNLYRAYVKARRGKRYQAEVLKFTMGLEDNLLGLYRELQGGTYTTGEYHYFTVYEPKKREVAALPFRDRIVHHAIHNILEPMFDRGFIYHSYACREGKGTHAGADQITRWLREIHRNHGQVYVLKADIKSYFASIDHAVLIDILKRKIRCRRTMALLRDIIYSAGSNGIGIPIGNLTSQLFANIYLNELDQYVKHQLRVHYYLRYMDDFIVLHHTKKKLRRWRYQIEHYLDERLNLWLNNRTAIFPEKRGVDFLGYRIWRTHRLLRKRSVKRMKRNLREFEEKYARGEISLEEIDASIQSWVGHAMHANTYNLRRKLFSNFRLRRD